MTMVTAPARTPLRHHAGKLLSALWPARRSRVAARCTAAPEDWYELGAVRHKARHVALFGPLVGTLGAPLRACGITTVVEFGCGDGRWLAWLRDQWPSIGEFRGVDPSASQIAANRNRHPHLRFDAGDPVAWAERSARPRSLFLTHCGVLACLPERSVDRLLAALARRAPGSMVCFVEPVADGLELAAADWPSTRRRGGTSWSHHYPARLAAAGLTVLDQQSTAMNGYRMLVLVGQTPVGQTPSSR